MLASLTIKNYRCFVQPVTIDIRKGFTAFVGMNNAGKSTVMRFLLEFRDLFQKMTAGRGEFITALRGPQGLQLSHVVDREEVFSNLNNEGLTIDLKFAYESSKPSAELPTSVRIQVTRTLEWRAQVVSGCGTFGDQLPSDVEFRGPHYLMRTNGVTLVDFKPIFDIASVLAKTLYIGPFRNTINVGSHSGYLDMEIGEAFIQRYRTLKTGPHKKQSTAMVKLTEDIRKIFEFENLNIEPTDDNKSLHITINGKPYKQHELGSGLLQFVIALANASVKGPSYVLIDEPELNLHPQLQLDFLTTLGAYASEGVWFTTHSIGLARSAAERVYSVQRQADGDSIVRDIESTPRLAEFLGEMNFSSHRELGFESVVLVEGPTDVKVVQRLLRKVQMDHKVILLPLSGRINGEMAAELEEVMRISTAVSAIIDSERSSADASLDNRRAAFVDLCKQMKVQCHVLQRRATENYFSDRAVKALFPDCRALGPYESFASMKPRWDKAQNWRLAEAMTLDEWRGTDLWGFLEGLTT